MIAVIIDIAITPDEFGRSYGVLDWGKYGVGAWFYEVHGREGIYYAGETEWVNFPRFITYPKHPNPHHFTFQPAPHVKYRMTGTFEVPGLSPIEVAGLAYKIIGAKIPLKLPLP